MTAVMALSMKDKHMDRGQFFHWCTHTERGQAKRLQNVSKWQEMTQTSTFPEKSATFYLSPDWNRI
jgi:hypothetical protein